MYLNFLNVHAFHAPESPDCAAESPEQVFHAPGQSPYSVLVEQRGVEELLLLESQVYWTLLCWTLDTVLCWSHRYTGHCTVLDTVVARQRRHRQGELPRLHQRLPFIVKAGLPRELIAKTLSVRDRTSNDDVLSFTAYRSSSLQTLTLMVPFPLQNTHITLATK